MRNTLIPLLLSFVILAAVLSGTTVAGTVILGTRFGGEIGGLSFSSGDLVKYHTRTGEAEIFLPESTFDNFVGTNSGTVPINLDAFALAPNGESFLFSARVGLRANPDTITRNGVTFSTFGSTVINQREVVLSDNRETENLEVLFDVLSTDISGIAALPNGNLLLTAKGDTAFSNFESEGLDFRVGDVIEFNPETGAGSLFFSADNFFIEGEDEGATRAVSSIDALDVLENGNLLLSTSNNVDVLQSTGDVFTLRQGGVYEFDFDTGDVSTFFDPEVFDDPGVDLKAFSVVSVPEPTHCCLLLGLLGVLGKRRRSI